MYIYICRFVNFHRANLRPEQHLPEARHGVGIFFLSPATWTGDYSLLYSVLLELSNFILYVVESSVLLRVCLPTAGLCAPPHPPQWLFVISRSEYNKLYPLKAWRDRFYIHFAPQSICSCGRRDFVSTAFTFGQRYLHFPLVAAVIWDVSEAQLIQQNSIWRQTPRTCCVTSCRARDLHRCQYPAIGISHLFR